MFWRSITRHDAWCSMMSFQTSNEESHHVQVCILHILVKKIIARVCVFLSVWGVQRVWSEQHFPPYKAWKPLAESSRWADQHPFGWAGSAFSFMSVCVCVCLSVCLCVSHYSRCVSACLAQDSCVKRFLQTLQQSNSIKQSANKP